MELLITSLIGYFGMGLVILILITKDHLSNGYPIRDDIGLFVCTGILIILLWPLVIYATILELFQD